MTNQEIFDVVDAINSIKKEKVKLNVKLSYELAKIKKILNPYYEAIIDTRQKKFIEHGDFDEKGDIIVAKDEVEDLKKDLKELFEIDNEVKVSKIALEEFEESGLNFDIIDNLMPIITDLSIIK